MLYAKNFPEVHNVAAIRQMFPFEGTDCAVCAFVFPLNPEP